MSSDSIALIVTLEIAPPAAVPAMFESSVARLAACARREADFAFRPQKPVPAPAQNATFSVLPERRTDTPPRRTAPPAAVAPSVAR